MKTSSVIILLLFFLTSCFTKTAPQEGEIGQGIDITADGNSILLSYVESEGIGIFEYDLHNSDLKRLTDPEKAWHLRPKFSPDETSILYIEYPNQSFENGNLILLNLENQNSEVIISDVVNLIDADFSTDGQSINFIQANSIGKIPNGNDLYKVDIASKEIQRITELNSYSFKGLTPLNDSTVLANIDGMGSVNTNTGKFTPITIENDPRKEVRWYHVPIDVKDSLLYYYALYQVYSYNFQTREPTLELGRVESHMQSIKMNEAGSKMVFTKSNKIYVYDLVKKELEEVNLNK